MTKTYDVCEEGQELKNLPSHRSAHEFFVETMSCPQREGGRKGVERIFQDALRCLAQQNLIASAMTADQVSGAGRSSSRHAADGVETTQHRRSLKQETEGEKNEPHST